MCTRQFIYSVITSGPMAVVAWTVPASSELKGREGNMVIGTESEFQLNK